MFSSKAFFMPVFTSALLISSCMGSKNGVPTNGSGMLQKIYVKQIDPGNIVSTADKVELKITGNLPSPAYTFARFDVKVSGNVIEVTPLAKYDPDKMVAQMLVSFSDICRVENLKPGVYELKIYGRGETVVETQGILVKK